MIITRISQISGKSHTRDIPVTQEQYDAWQQGGIVIQQAFPQLSADDREFLMTGITPEEWDETFTEPEE